MPIIISTTDQELMKYFTDWARLTKEGIKPYEASSWQRELTGEPKMWESIYAED